MKAITTAAVRPKTSATKPATTYHPHALEGCDLSVAPIVPCLFCGCTVPLVSFAVNTAHVNGRAVSYAKCPDCWEAFARTTASLKVAGAVSIEALKRHTARCDRLVRKHLADRVLPVARALAANAEALIATAAA